MIVETLAKRYFLVFPITRGDDRPDSAMSHLWHGIELRHVKKGRYVEKLTKTGKQRWTYVVKARSRVVEN